MRRDVNQTSLAKPKITPLFRINGGTTGEADRKKVLYKIIWQVVFKYMQNKKFAFLEDGLRQSISHLTSAVSVVTFLS